MPNGYIDYSAPYFAEKERGRQQISQEVAYASAIAEQLGQYTPELQAQALRPLGYTPTVGESMIGAPVRGLGKLLGIEKLQQVGAPRPFDIGQVQEQAAPQYPPLPEGTPPEMREALEGIAQQMGYTPQPEPTTTPSVPSEVVGKPRLKTKVERDTEQAQQERVWDLIMQTYQTDQERQMAEAQIAQTIQATKESQARQAEIIKRTARGISPTEHSLIADHMEENDMSVVDVTRQLKAVSKSKPAALVIYNDQVAAGHFSGTFLQWKAALESVKHDPIDTAAKQFYSHPWAKDEIPLEGHAEAITQIALTLAEATKKLNEAQLAETGKGLVEKDIPIPRELVAQGVDKVDVWDFMEKYNIPSYAQAIEMMMNYLKQQNSLRQGQSGQPAARTLGK